MNANRKFILGISALVGLIQLTAKAEPYNPHTDYNNEKQLQPYIEKLKEKNGIQQRPYHTPEELKPSAANSKPAVPTDTAKTPQEVQPYIEQLREKEGLPPSEELKLQRSGDLNQQYQPYIETVKKGHELEPKYKKIVDQSVSFTVAVDNLFDVKGGIAEANAFEAVYGTKDSGKYHPGFDFSYEKQFLRSRYLGALGFVGHAGFMLAKGKGIFTRTGQQSTQVDFRFHAVPVMAGLSYKLVQLRFLVPFAQFSFLGVPFIETRNDDKPSRRGASRGYSVVGGVAMNLDWITRKDAWEQYDNHDIIHTYLVAQAEYMRTTTGPVRFNYDGIYAGLMFEF